MSMKLLLPSFLKCKIGFKKISPVIMQFQYCLTESINSAKNYLRNIDNIRLNFVGGKQVQVILLEVLGRLIFLQVPLEMKSV